jgi:AcrR family transcriptional regulator
MTTARKISRQTPAGRARPEPPALRERILATAEALLEAEGLQALSLREVARRAGVTHQAPYHHFADRESILAELVAQGFDELARRLAKANDAVAQVSSLNAAGVAAEPDLRRALVLAGSAYVGHAIEHPGVFRIMFRREVCDPARFPAALAASERAYRELLRLVALLHGGQQDAALISTYWATVHGLAGLLIDGPLAEQLPTLAAKRAHMRATLGQFAAFVLGPSARQSFSSSVPDSRARSSVPP